MKEIKATAPTRKELYQEYKRVREENERLTKRLERKTKQMLKWKKVAFAWYSDFKQLENKTND